MSEVLPLLHDSDAFHLTLSHVSPGRVRLERVVRYPYNQNVEGVEESFRDLDPETKRAIIRQINRRYIGRTVLT